jgi:hypothetical protein
MFPARIPYARFRKVENTYALIQAYPGKRVGVEYYSQQVMSSEPSNISSTCYNIEMLTDHNYGSWE